MTCCQRIPKLFVLPPDIGGKNPEPFIFAPRLEFDDLHVRGTADKIVKGEIAEEIAGTVFVRDDKS